MTGSGQARAAGAETNALTGSSRHLREAVTVCVVRTTDEYGRKLLFFKNSDVNLKFLPAAEDVMVSNKNLRLFSLFQFIIRNRSEPSLSSHFDQEQCLHPGQLGGVVRIGGEVGLIAFRRDTR